MKISVIIPTYKRPDYLYQALNSCIKQSRLPDEILIGDDSPDDDSKIMVEKFLSSSPVSIRYYHNKPSLRQAMNVNDLINRVQNQLLLLLHDDDILLPNALSDMEACFITHPEIDIVYGKQHWMLSDGTINENHSLGLNNDFYRTEVFEGMKLSSLEAGFLQQFPNDGFLMRTALAQKVQYSDAAGDACDFDFGLRVGMQNVKTYFINSYTAAYRNSDEAVTKRPGFNGATKSFALVEQLEVPEQSYAYKAAWLKKRAPVAIVEAINLKNVKTAKTIYFSKWHKEKIFTPGGIKRLLLLLKAYIQI